METIHIVTTLLKLKIKRNEDVQRGKRVMISIFYFIFLPIQNVMNVISPNRIMRI